MSVNITDKEQNSIALMNVSYYNSKADYMTNTFADVTIESASENFKHILGLGYIKDITCGTYNGATDEFDTWELTDNNILDTIFNALHEDDFYNFVALYKDEPDELAELEQWTVSDWIREYTEVHEVFIIGGSVYVNQD